MSNQGEKLTFWTLINRHTIQIPPIQRDYVQGMAIKISDGKKKNSVLDFIAETRDFFLDDLYKAVKNKTPLDLNFIYGRIHMSDEEKFFIPLDGQQRLTTLFLLHWYAFMRANATEKISTLKNFSYDTRASSRRFCSALVENSAALNKEKIFDAASIKTFVEDEPWFLMDWFQDPTIQAMLNMLDCLHKKFSDVDDLARRLVDDELITFHFLDMENLELEESVYVKINARGKPLTEFENFKARLSEFMRAAEKNNRLQKNFAENFGMKADSCWTDFFWNFQGRKFSNVSDRKQTPKIVDDVFMHCIHAIFCNQLALSAKSLTDENVRAALGKISGFSFQNYCVRLKKIFSTDDEVDNFLVEFVHRLENFLDGVSDKKGNLRMEIRDDVFLSMDKLFKKVDDISGLTYSDRILFFAATEYFYHHGINSPEENFGTWMQVVRRLIENTRLEELDAYISAIRAVNDLIPHANEILDYLRRGDKVARFNETQVAEERIKARLLLKGDGWKNSVREMNRHKYLNGQAQGLLAFAGIWQQAEKISAWTGAESQTALKNFSEYQKTFCEFFPADGNGLKDDSNLFRRALLSFGDYTLKSQSMCSFLIDNDRDISWRSLLRNDTKRIHLKNFLDAFRTEKNLQKIIDANLKIIPAQDWRYYFVKHAELMNYCTRKYFWRNGSDIILTATSTTRSYNREYFTYALKLELDAEKISSDYVEERGRDSEKYLMHVGGKNIQVSYWRTTDGEYFFWVEKMPSGQEIERFKTLDETKAFIRSLP